MYRMLNKYLSEFISGFTIESTMKLEKPMLLGPNWSVETSLQDQLKINLPG